MILTAWLRRGERDGNRHRQKGYALVMVIWVMAILTLMALGFSRSLTVGSAGLSNSTGAIRAEVLAQAALERGLHALLNPGAEQSWKLDGTGYSFSFGGAVLTFSLEDEHGKIDLNTADRPLLLALFGDLLSGLPQTEGQDITADIMVDRLLDWRDADDLTRLDGAEIFDYEAMSYDVGPANRPFRSVSEIQQVLGMTRALYEELEDSVTVHSQERTINPLHAKEKLLRIIPGLGQAEVDVFLSLRAEYDYADKTVPEPALTGGRRYLNRDVSAVYTVTGRADLSSGISYLKQVIVWKTGGGRLSGRNRGDYKILEIRKDRQISSGHY